MSYSRASRNNTNTADMINPQVMISPCLGFQEATPPTPRPTEAPCPLFNVAFDYNTIDSNDISVWNSCTAWDECGKS